VKNGLACTFVSLGLAVLVGLHLISLPSVTHAGIPSSLPSHSRRLNLCPYELFLIPSLHLEETHCCRYDDDGVESQPRGCRSPGPLTALSTIHLFPVPRCRSRLSRCYTKSSTTTTTPPITPPITSTRTITTSGDKKTRKWKWRQTNSSPELFVQGRRRRPDRLNQLSGGSSPHADGLTPIYHTRVHYPEPGGHDRRAVADRSRCLYDGVVPDERD
jgi:hypothetical protein